MLPAPTQCNMETRTAAQRPASQVCGAALLHRQVGPSIGSSQVSRVAARPGHFKGGKHLRTGLAGHSEKRVPRRREAHGVNRVPLMRHELPERFAVRLHAIEVVQQGLVVHAACHHAHPRAVHV